MKRVIIYATVYGCVGAVLGALMAFYTQDTTTQQALFNRNHRTPDGSTSTTTEVQKENVTS